MLMNTQCGNDKDSTGDRYECVFVNTECGVDFITHVNFLWYGNSQNYDLALDIDRPNAE